MIRQKFDQSMKVKIQKKVETETSPVILEKQEKNQEKEDIEEESKLPTIDEIRVSSEIQKKQKIDLGKKWSSLPVALHKKIHDSIQSFGFEFMTPVQENTIPQLLSFKDVVVEACTGSGKSLAYLIPIYQLLLKKERKKDEINAIVIVPTRELAYQVYEVAQTFTKKTGITSQLITGGKFDNEGYKGEIAFCTPGRLLEILEKKDQYELNLKNFEILIIDEADRILDMGFEKQVNGILYKLPKQRRTGLFSATQTSEMDQLIRSGLRNPVKVTVMVDSKTQIKTPKELNNYYMFVPYDQKISHLVHFLKNHKDTKVIIYFLTCACVDYFFTVLKLYLKDCQLFSLHGQMVVTRREKTYQEFIEAEKGFLICTDVAARGLDIQGVEYIIQYDAPQDPSIFIHRAGRTGRMGKSGVSLLFVDQREDEFIHLLTSKKVPMKEVLPSPNCQDILETLKKEILSDRDLFEKSEEGFVSFIRAYKEHQCSYIFKFQKLNLDLVAKGYCLLRHPKGIFKNFTLKFTFEQEDIDFDGISYKDPKREEARQNRMKNPKPKKKKEKIERDKGIFEKKQEIRQLPSKKKRKRAMEFLEIDELNKEATLLKKLKRGELSESQYEVFSGEIDFELSGLKSAEKKKKTRHRKKVSKKKI